MQLADIKLPLCTLATALIAFAAAPVAAADLYYELSGNTGAELRFFTESPVAGKSGDANQEYNTSLSIEPEFYWEWNQGQDNLTFAPFLRIDENDNERTHADIRELSWVHVKDNVEFRTGIRKVFWGVTEFQHLVDVINQTDGVEDIDNEDKLGQPMINWSAVNDWGILDAYLLIGFRERTFPGLDGRLRSIPHVDADQTSYESGAKDKHIDTAVRWSHTLDAYDLALYWFRGTNRQPQLLLDNSGSTPVLTPYYEQMNQVGFELQATLDSWLWKLETIHRNTESDDFWASQAGFEYTFYGIQGSSTDLGLLLEHGWDERGDDAAAAFQNDLSVGARLTLNDVASTELLAGFVHDLDHQSLSFQVEASRRLNDHWKLSVDGRFFSANEPEDPIYSLEKDDHLQLRVDFFF